MCPVVTPILVASNPNSFFLIPVAFRNLESSSDRYYILHDFSAHLLFTFAFVDALFGDVTLAFFFDLYTELIECVDEYKVEIESLGLRTSDGEGKTE